MSKSRSGSVLVLMDQNTDRMIFEFRGKRWSIITFALALISGIGLYTASAYSKYPALLAVLALIFASLFIYASIHNYFAQRKLIIDNKKHSIRYIRKDLFQNDDWERPFSNFRELRVFRNIAGSGTGKSAWLRLSLVDKNDNNIILGTNELGFFGKEKALRIAEDVSSLTALPLTVE